MSSVFAFKSQGERNSHLVYGFAAALYLRYYEYFAYLCPFIYNIYHSKDNPARLRKEVTLCLPSAAEHEPVRVWCRCCTV